MEDGSHPAYTKRLSFGFARQPWGATAYVGLQGSDWLLCELTWHCEPASSSGDANPTISSSSGGVQRACSTALAS